MPFNAASSGPAGNATTRPKTAACTRAMGSCLADGADGGRRFHMRAASVPTPHRLENVGRNEAAIHLNSFGKSFEDLHGDLCRHLCPSCRRLAGHGQPASAHPGLMDVAVEEIFSACLSFHHVKMMNIPGRST